MILREVTYFSVVMRICAAVLIGGLLGVERGKKNRPAGLRTYMLVCVGSCLIMLTNQYIFQVTGAGDPMRLGAQVISGIGFLGAGTIIVTKRNQIKGLTTAAGLWSTAGVGLALGIGFYEAAITATLSIYFILTVLQYWDSRMHQRAKIMELYLEHSDQIGLGVLIREIRNVDVEIQEIQVEQGSTIEEDARSLILTLKLPKQKNHAVLISEIQKMAGVLYVEEL